MKKTNFWMEKVRLRKAAINEMKEWMKEKNVQEVILPTDMDEVDELGLDGLDIPFYSDTDRHGQKVDICPKKLYLNDKDELCGVFITEDGDDWQAYNIENAFGSFDEILDTHAILYEVLTNKEEN